MPELPEVERARKLIADSCTGYKIKSVDANEDKIVYTGGTNHEEFAKELEGRTITGCERKGKTFWMTLSGEGRLPVMHFGMTGMLQLKGQEPTWYRRRPKEKTTTWPPRFCKFILELEPQTGSVSDEPRELAFIDGRRLGRLRLVPSPVADYPPVKQLGFDPMLSYPSFEEFKDLLKKKKGTTKGVIMDQGFSAGVGNWVADEILYQARLHPACPIPALSEDDLKRLHHWIRKVPEIAVGVNADSKQFPEDWLFRWRWGKGKKQERRAKLAKGVEGDSNASGGEELEAEIEVKLETAEADGEDEEAGEDIRPKGKDFLALPDGKPAIITFIEVGGRTTAFVADLQKMPDGVEMKPKISKGGKGSRSDVKKRKGSGSGSDEVTPPGLSGKNDAANAKEEVKPRVTTPRQKAAAAKRIPEEKADEPAAAKKPRKSASSTNGSGKAAISDMRSGEKPSKGGKGGRSSKGGGRSRRRAESSDLSDAPED